MCQRLTYEEFVQKLRKWIIKDAHLPEDYVFLKKKRKDRNNRKWGPVICSLR